jgi:glucose-6-phosphate isomerase
MINSIFDKNYQNLIEDSSYEYIKSLYFVEKLLNTDEKFFEELKKQIKILSKFNTLLVFGIGGSCLGGKLISSFGKNIKTIKFYDTIDEDILVQGLEILNLKDVASIFISKSGHTLETVIQYELVLMLYKKRLIQYNKNLLFLTKEGSYLHKKSIEVGGTFLPFDQLIGGRYSCFTEAALIPAMFKDVSYVNYIAGAKKCVKDFLSKESDITKNINFALNNIKNKSQYALLSYAQNLDLFNSWFVQLLSESSGKNGVGMTPISYIGTKDQHSMLQLFLDGINDKIYTIIVKKAKKDSTTIKFEDENFSYLNKSNISEILNTNAVAVFNVLKNRNRNVRLIEVENLNECLIGYLNMYFIIENILLCKQLGVDPFDQPAVEFVKQEIKNILSL